MTTAESVTVAVLSLVDIALLANLIIIVIFAGYENFVSRLTVVDDHRDKPAWMGHVDFSGLKMKLIGSLVAISAILLLKDFVKVGDTNTAVDYHAIGWQIGMHLTFVFSGLVFAIMDYWGAKRLQGARANCTCSAGTPWTKSHSTPTPSDIRHAPTSLVFPHAPQDADAAGLQVLRVGDHA